MREFQAVTLDGDGTLWNFDAAMRSALVTAAERLTGAGLRPGGGAVTAGWLKQLRDEVAAAPEFRGASMEAIRLASLHRAAAEGGADEGGGVADEVVQAVYEQYMVDRFALLELYADAAPALARLGRRFRLALITNGNTPPERVGLAGVFEVVVNAFECQYFKPDPAIYRHALGLLSLPATACLHVGDDPVEDVVAAREAGLATAWLDRRGAAWSRDGRPDLVVRDLTALCDELGA